MLATNWVDDESWADAYIELAERQAKYLASLDGARPAVGRTLRKALAAVQAQLAEHEAVLDELEAEAETDDESN